MRVRIISKDQDKRELIQDLSSQGSEVALYMDDLCNVPSRSKLVREGLVIIKSPLDFEELEKAWYYGNWSLTCPAVTDYSPLNTFVQPDEVVADKMRGLGLSVIIDSFHDNTDWKVYQID